MQRADGVRPALQVEVSGGRFCQGGSVPGPGGVWAVVSGWGLGSQLLVTIPNTGSEPATCSALLRVSSCVVSSEMCERVNLVLHVLRYPIPMQLISSLIHMTHITTMSSYSSTNVVRILYANVLRLCDRYT